MCVEILGFSRVSATFYSVSLVLGFRVRSVLLPSGSSLVGVCRYLLNELINLSASHVHGSPNGYTHVRPAVVRRSAQHGRLCASHGGHAL